MDLNLSTLKDVSNINSNLAINKKNTAQSVSFLNEHNSEISNLYNKLNDGFIMQVPSELVLASAKVKVAFEECLKFFEYEYIPNKGDIEAFTDEEITDEDFDNAEILDSMFVSLSEVVTNQVGERDTLDETIDTGAYEEQEMKDAIYESLNLLSKSERELLMYRFGLDNRDEFDIRQLAKMYHTSNDEMEKRVSKALTNMRAVLSTMIRE